MPTIKSPATLRWSHRLSVDGSPPRYPPELTAAWWQAERSGNALLWGPTGVTELLHATATEFAEVVDAAWPVVDGADHAAVDARAATLASALRTPWSRLHEAFARLRDEVRAAVREVRRAGGFPASDLELLRRLGVFAEVARRGWEPSTLAGELDLARTRAHARLEARRDALHAEALATTQEAGELLDELRRDVRAWPRFDDPSFDRVYAREIAGSLRRGAETLRRAVGIAADALRLEAPSRPPSPVPDLQRALDAWLEEDTARGPVGRRRACAAAMSHELADVEALAAALRDLLDPRADDRGPPVPPRAGDPPAPDDQLPFTHRRSMSSSSEPGCPRQSTSPSRTTTA
ncbi:MAG: hypothetical protein H6732_06540 [Alphaproteobacteria bacterium]|nr:hypothetical protein [Alphaproteobacteria bacterium]